MKVSCNVELGYFDWVPIFFDNIKSVALFWGTSLVFTTRANDRFCVDVSQSEITDILVERDAVCFLDFVGACDVLIAKDSEIVLLAIWQKLEDTGATLDDPHFLVRLAENVFMKFTVITTIVADADHWPDQFATVIGVKA